MRAVLHERSSRKTVSLKEQMMSEDKYTINFPCQIKAIVFISLQIFFLQSRYKMFMNSLPFTTYGTILWTNKCFFFYKDSKILSRIE